MNGTNGAWITAAIIVGVILFSWLLHAVAKPPDDVDDWLDDRAERFNYGNDPEPPAA